MLPKARELAVKAHTLLYGELPYVTHLDDVYNVLVEFNITNKNTLIAAYLHDIIEDTKYTYKDIWFMFNRTIADIVWAVTDKHGKNRAERHRNTYPELAYDINAISLKLADRISNVRRSIGKDIYKMYKKEYAYFKETLYKNNDIHAKMWAELDKLMEV
jgi:(p)ppGpp synthase/HD superfamily hydrolase